jgi:hypothetical protein
VLPLSRTSSRLRLREVGPSPGGTGGRVALVVTLLRAVWCGRIVLCAWCLAVVGRVAIPFAAHGGLILEDGTARCGQCVGVQRGSAAAAAAVIVTAELAEAR